MEKKSFSYDEYSDSLIVSNRQENEAVKNNFEVGDIVFSLTGKGKIVAVEIKEVSSFLESCNINPSIIRCLSDVELRIIPKRETIFLALTIKFLEGEMVVSKNIPMVVPLVK
jgi:uncharacterized protein YuzE